MNIDFNKYIVGYNHIQIKLRHKYLSKLKEIAKQLGVVLEKSDDSSKIVDKIFICISTKKLSELVVGDKS